MPTPVTPGGQAGYPDARDLGIVPSILSWGLASHNEEHTMIDRRRLFQLMMAGSAGLALPDRSLLASAPGGADDWLDEIAGRTYRAFLDIRSFIPDGLPFRKATNLLRALTEAYGADPADVGIAFGAGSTSIAHVLGPAVWRTYPLGDVVAKYASGPEEAHSLRTEPDKWAAAGGAGVRDLRAKGMRVLACRNSIMHMAREFASKTGESAEAVNAKLLAGLHEGVEPVPAMVAAAVLAQARQLSYVAIG